ncbi:MAG: hypothetical protein M1819_002062 [Sarea resinae]|nr:MAG: hypothetical protein M1819_002062 [Sarea resinae]
MSSKTEVRPVRVANCSGYHGDPAYEMYRQATLGDVDFITGDYLAEVNLANNAQAYHARKHPGYEETAWEGIQQTIDVIARKRIRVVINGGALNPKGLAEKVETLVSEKKLNLRVAYLSGDDMHSQLGPNMPSAKEQLLHLDADNHSVVPADLTYSFLENNNGKPVPMVSAHAYLGARGIVDGLRRGADIIICGRVADASPVIAAAWFWHDWKETDYDRIAGSLIAGHLIECSAYITGANFAGFDKYPLDDLVAPGFPIAEIASDGSCIITKHPNTQGFVNIDTVRCQFLYELQGTNYLNSDVNAFIGDVRVEDTGNDRVRVSGIRGSPPPPTTKLAVFYPAGYEAEILLNATGYATAQKWDLLEKQIRHFLPPDVLNSLSTLEFQRVGTPAPNPISQLDSTTYLRIFVASLSEQSVAAVSGAMKDVSLKHFSEINFIDGSTKISSFSTGHPSRYEALRPRENYDPQEVKQFIGPTKDIRLGDVALARSGDKGANLNFGIFVLDARHWEWLQSFMTRSRMRWLLGNDWSDSFFIERVEFPHIHAVHFVIYGILGRGVSSSSRLDGFGKGFADYIRDKVISFPAELL